MNKQIVIRSALASIIALAGTSAITTAHAADDTTKEKCFGIAKAGANDCASTTGAHSCAGQSKADMSLNEWKYTAKGSCEKMGGKLTASAGMMKKDDMMKKDEMKKG
jgi:uncharacterized membrane protein